MALAADLGTMFCVKGSIDEVDQSAIFSVERNVFAQVRENLEDPEEVLKENNYAYVKHDGKFYVIGEDVFKVHEIESLFKKSGASSYFSEMRRPMKDGLINIAEEKKAIAIIQAIIKRLIGKPAYENEVLCFCSPDDPTNVGKNALFHKTILSNFISSLGFHVECINEALAIIFSECPVVEDPNEPDGIAKFSGISMSFGAGCVNSCCAWKQLPLLTLANAHSGDWVDQEASKVAGCEIATITRYKEKYFDLSKSSDDVKHMALEVYYKAMIENAVKNFASRFESLDEKDEKISAPLPIVIAGGTASVPGFVPKFEEVLSKMTLPFVIKEVRLAKSPLYSVANGCLTKAISIESKQRKQKSTPQPKQETKSKEKMAEIKKENSPKKIKLQ